MNLPVLYEELEPKERKAVREEYIKVQEGLCYFCGKTLSGPPHQNIEDAKINSKLFPDNFFKYPIHLHHSHDTGLTLGAVHAKCNAYLWEYNHE